MEKCTHIIRDMQIKHSTIYNHWTDYFFFLKSKKQWQCWQYLRAPGTLKNFSWEFFSKTTLGNWLTISTKVHHIHNLYSAILLLGICPTELCSHITKNQVLKCSQYYLQSKSGNNQNNHLLWYIHTMEYISMRMKELLLHPITWMISKTKS